MKSLSIKSAFCDEYACGNDENIAQIHSGILPLQLFGIRVYAWMFLLVSMKAVISMNACVWQKYGF